MTQNEDLKEKKIEKEEDNTNSTELPEKIPMKSIVIKLNNNRLSIEDLLNNDQSIEELITNSSSRFKKIITTENIKKLIKFCLFPNPIKDKDKDFQQQLRYTYYSCQILCSQCVLLFDKSIKNIKESNNLKNNKEENYNKYNNINNNTVSSENEKNEIRNGNIDINNKDKEIYLEIDNQNNSDEIIGETLFDEFNKEKENENENDLYEKYIDSYNNQINEIKTQKEEIKRRASIDYEEEDMKLINEILDEIFQILDSEEIESTCSGYFQKMVNYLIFNEEDIIIKYLFKDSDIIMKKLYRHINNNSIKNILENILYRLTESKEENDIKKSKFEIIMNGLFEELESDQKFQKSENICELIINTLITNTDNELFELILKKKNIIEKLKEILGKIIDKENNDKIIIGISQIISKLNDVIIYSLKDTLSNNPNNKEEDNHQKNLNIRRINSYEYLYEKEISYKNILNDFQKNMEDFFKKINKIYIIIKNNIKKNR